MGHPSAMSREGRFHEARRRRMVTEQLKARGIQDAKVLEAMGAVPRHRFVPGRHRPEAYDDRPLPIGCGQTISQPYMVALMTEWLSVRPGAKVLEVGTGSGYQSAVLARMGARVFSVERIPELGEAARARLEGLGIRDVRIRAGDGSLGWPEEAPFDGIIVTAYAPEVPDRLTDQLAEGGRLVIPVGDDLSQQLLVVERRGGRLTRRSVCGCLFVPLVGEAGWPESEVDPGLGDER